MNPIAYFRKMTKYEQVWSGIFSGIILLATIIFSIQGTNWNNWFSILLNWIISPISALTGVWCVILVARGSIHNWWIGLINAILYGWLSFVTGYYGDWLINWFFFVPTQIWIFYTWKDNLRSKDIVKMKKFSFFERIIIIIGSVLGIILFGLFLTQVNSWLTIQLQLNQSIYGTITSLFGISLLGPLFDATTEMLQFLGQIFLIKRYAEQWFMWIGTNVFSVIMWFSVVLLIPDSLPWSLPTLIMWFGFLVNSFYGLYTWNNGVLQTNSPIIVPA